MSFVAHTAFGDPDDLPLVALHGIGSTMDSWAEVARHLEGHYVLAWSMPGYGQSAPLSRDWPDAEDYAKALTGWLDSLDIRRFRLIGHSLGALIAARTAVLRPDQVEVMILASPAIGHGIAPPCLSNPVQERLATFHAEGPHAFAAKRAPRLLHDPRGDALEKVTQQMAQLTDPGHTQAGRLLSGGALLNDMVRLCVPTDIIVGANDIITPPKNAQACHNACPGRYRGGYAELPGVGHALAAEVPAGFAAAIRNSFTERAIQK